MVKTVASYSQSSEHCMIKPVCSFQLNPLQSVFNRQQLCEFIVTNESISTTGLVCESNMAAFLLLGDICHVDNMVVVTSCNKDLFVVFFALTVLSMFCDDDDDDDE